MYQFFLFDLDGTLADTLTDIAICANDTLARYGLHTYPTERYREFIGKGAREIFCRAMAAEPAETVPEETLLKMLEEYDAYYHLHQLDNTRPYPGVIELLEECRRLGIKTGVLSNKPHVATCEVVEGLGLDQYLTVVYGGRKEFPLKPDPTVPLMIAEECGASPKETLYLGDMWVDMQTAQNAGFRPLGAGWGLSGRDELLASGADLVFDSAAELTQWLRTEWGK